MVCITAAEVEQIAQQHAARMAAKRKQRSSWTPTGRASEEAIVEVELARRGLSDVSALAEFPGIGRVDISGNCLVDLSGLSRCVELRWVKASANRLSSTTGVCNATKLKALLLDHNIITELGTINQLSALQTLDLSHNPLATPVEGLAAMQGLTTLVLSNCGLSSLPSLHGFDRLTKLVLSSNSLQQLPDVPDSAALRELRIDSNRIRQAAGVVDSERTSCGPRLRLLDLSGNPLDDSADTIKSVGEVCKQLEVLLLTSPVGVDAGSLMDSEWAAALHHLPRLKTLNGSKWKRDKAKASAQTNGSRSTIAGETTRESYRSQTSANTVSATEALRAVLGTLDRYQLATLMKSADAGVNLTKELRVLQTARPSSEPGCRKRRLQSPSHCNDGKSGGKNLDPSDNTKTSKSASKKIAKRLAKKLGRTPTQTEVAALVVQKQKKARKENLKKATQ